MLSKLLKYEFKATAKMFLFMYIGLIAIAIVNMGLTSMWGNFDGFLGVLSGLMMTFYVISIIAVFVVTIIAVIIRFYKNQLGDEGYLMFTLPVSVEKHIFSKLIASIVWLICSFIVCLLSVMIITAISAAKSGFYGQVSAMWQQAQAAGVHPGAWLLCIIVFLLISMTGGVITFYCAMAIGPHITRNRLGGSILGYIIIYVISQIIGAVAIFAFSSPLLMNPRMIDGPVGIASTDLFGFFPWSGIETQTFNSTMLTFFFVCVLMELAVAIPCFFVTRHFLKKKLNLA